MWSHSSILQSARSRVRWPVRDVVEDALTSSACTRRRMTSGWPGSRTLTSGSSAQKPKQPTAASCTSSPSLVDGFGEGVIDALGAVAACRRCPCRRRCAGVGAAVSPCPASRTALKVPMSWMRHHFVLLLCRGAPLRDAASARSCGRRSRGPTRPRAPARTGRSRRRCAGEFAVGVVSAELVGAGCRSPRAARDPAAAV